VGSVRLPPCGLYRTAKPLPGAEGEVGDGLLVNFHNHGARGMPVVLLPAFNMFNRWQWKSEPHHVRQLSWIDSLERLPLEGFYALGRELPVENGTATWPIGTLVQLGYDRSATAIVFVAQHRLNLSDNYLWFSDRGIAIDDDALASLQALTVYEEPDPEAPPEEGERRDEK
jgi:hypothetical protein